ncbi:hypothetical protein MOD71_18610 [Bacillus haynesii]|uniref:hypothetical protein n=1 Tax=Bacillus haynesii TaxID=1925021 RepID=UPI002280B81B|nr:hypothetical protein [Bacillus haynesii]MCY8737519.1 hypothetical protein [Bacillus haynesii]
MEDLLICKYVKLRIARVFQKSKSKTPYILYFKLDMGEDFKEFVKNLPKFKEVGFQYDLPIYKMFDKFKFRETSTGRLKTTGVRPPLSKEWTKLYLYEMMNEEISESKQLQYPWIYKNILSRYANEKFFTAEFKNEKNIEELVSCLEQFLKRNFMPIEEAYEQQQLKIKKAQLNGFEIS